MAELDLSIGRWALMPGCSGRISASAYDLIEITKVTDKLVKGRPSYGRSDRQFPKDTVMATFASKDEAARLIDRIAGVRGDRDRRVKAANDAAEEAIDKAILAATS
jgi:hypothetical protein